MLHIRGWGGGGRGTGLNTLTLLWMLNYGAFTSYTWISWLDYTGGDLQTPVWLFQRTKNEKRAEFSFISQFRFPKFDGSMLICMLLSCLTTNTMYL